MPFTQTQKQAIEAPPHISLTISAGAGSGKTTVLVERILHLVGEGCELEKMLVVTFTRAAAASMRNKLQQALEKRAATDKDGWYRRALEQLVTTEISTLHAFCKNALQRFYFLTPLPPDFTILDERKAALLRQKALQQALEEASARAETDPLWQKRLSMFLQGRNADSLVNAVDFAARTLFESSHPGEAAKEIMALYQKPLTEEHPWVAAERGRALDRLNAAGELFSQAGALLPPGSTLQANINHALDMLQALRTCPLLELPANLQAFKAVTQKKLDFPAAQEFLSLWETAKQAVKDLRDSVRPYCHPQAQQDIMATGEALEALFTVALDFLQRYLESKLAEGGCEFDDLEQQMVDLLENHPAAAAELRAGYEYIFVDEYQDTNPKQDRIAELISRGGNLFVVGDVKQSIYRFRRAEPQLFLRRLSGPGTRIDLSHNFRSQARVQQCVNWLFARLMTPAAAELRFDEAARMTPPEGGWQTRVGNPGCACGQGAYPLPCCADTAAEILLVPKKGGGPELEELTQREAEAEAAADRIAELLTQTVYDPLLRACRPIEFRDIVLLSRQEKSVSPTYIDVFARRGLPLYSQPAGGFFDRYEVALCLQLLRVLERREEDVPLLAVLLSPIGGFTARELAELRAGQEGPVYQSLLFAKENAKVARFLQLLDRLSFLSHATALEAFLWRLYQETGLLCWAAALPGGAFRAENLRLLASRAAEYDADFHRGAAGFVQYAASLREAGTQYATALAENEDENVLRFMSIHKSKGLEFPIVLLCECGSRLDKPRTAQLAADSVLGMGMQAVWEQDSCFTRRATLPLCAIREEKARKERAEDVRLLYVAMTRASQKLILLGKGEDIPAFMPPDPLLSADSFFGWIFPLLAGGGHPFAVRRAEAGRGAKKTAAAAESARLLTGRLTPEEQAWKQRLQQRFAWRYPYQAATAQPVKQAVTTAPGRITLELPQNPEEQAAALAGTGAHIFLQRADLFGNLTQEADRLAAEGYLTPEQRAALPLAGIAKLAATPVFLQLAASPRVEKEAAFCVPVNQQEGVFTILQGKMDCYFETAEGLCLLDYKLAKIRTPEEAAAHAPQLRLYARALSDLTGRPVAHAYVCSLTAGQAVEISLE